VEGKLVLTPYIDGDVSIATQITMRNFGKQFQQKAEEKYGHVTRLLKKTNFCSSNIGHAL
jgi:hypothetical protein